MVNVVRSDLEFILQQIATAEAHAAGTPLPTVVPNPFAPFGLRTVDGSFNNLIPGQSLWGSADQVFPRLLTPVWRDADVLAFDPDGPGPQQAGDTTSYAQTRGVVVDAAPRTISNLISDQTTSNAAAVAAAGPDPDVSDDGTLSIPQVSPDAGLSAPLNAWFTFFGQFFDHGLDLVNKGGSGLVYVPLAEDDPLFNKGADDIAGTADDGPNFMLLTRATNLPGQDGILGTADDIHEHVNQTTPFIDQNQTYTSNPSHQVFLREYELDGSGKPVATGRLLDNRGAGADGEYFTADDVPIGGLTTWAVVKAAAAHFLGIQLTDADVTNLPMLATDQYGRFERGLNGFAQLVTPGGLVEGNPNAPVGTAGAIRTGHAFLDDIAHGAAPKFLSGALNPDADTVAGGAPPAGTYDNELLDAHYVTGDGRGNENIGLSAVHHVFHAEHNRLVDAIKQEILDSGDPDFIAEWQLPGGDWNGERLFQAARFSTEMQYQHLVFEEFARTVQPTVDLFGDYSSDINPAIFAEFAHTVYRFGHTMLTDTVARTNADGTSNDIGLIEAFLNPLEFAASGPTPDEAAGAIVRGMTGQVANEIDEFVTEALRNNLVGLPLDLATINIARGRDTGIPSLNAARREFHEGTGGDSALKPYESWQEFGFNIKNPESLVNFVAAYGTHSSITDATTMEDRRAAAIALVLGTGDDVPEDRLDFLTSEGAWASTAAGVTTTGLDDVDFWIGGLAERQMPFGGILGSTFAFVFELQIERLQDADRFYYLARTDGLNFLAQLEADSFAELIMRNTDATHLHFNVFFTPTYTIEVSDPATWPAGLVIDLPGESLRFTGEDHVVLGGTAGANHLISGDGDDALWGDGGNDTLEGGAGNDAIIGGDGDDTITDSFGDDVLKGGDGNDSINAGGGLDLVLGGAGDDTITGTEDEKEVFAGAGNDILFGGGGGEGAQGNAGDDWLEGRGGDDRLSGDDGNPGIPASDNGNDVLIGGTGSDRMFGEGGNDIFIGGDGLDRHFGNEGFDWISYQQDTLGVSADLLVDANLLPPLAPSPDAFADRFREVEGLSGSGLADMLRGDDSTGNRLTQINLITGLPALLGGAAPFLGGNIILGGDGSDTIEGRGGDDFIDGDAALHVALTAPGPGRQIVREIRSPANVADDVDRAVFSQRIALYDITRNPDGTLTVVHARGRLTDGTDTLQNIEELSFNGGVVSITGPNNAATGAPTIQDTTPTEGQLLRASTAGISDADGLAGVAFGFQWQSFDGVLWSDIAGATGITFVPAQGQVGSQLRVVVSYTDNLGWKEEVVSASTAGVGDLFAGGNASDNPLLTAFDDSASGNDGDDSLFGLDGHDLLNGGSGNDLLNGGAGADTLDGGGGSDTASYENGGAVVVSLGGIPGSFTGEAAGDVLRSVENLRGSTTGADDLAGNDQANRLEGLGGNDTLGGGAGRDTLAGGADLDTLSGGGQADRFQWLALTDSGASALTADRVLDFAIGRGGDILDLSPITPAGDADGTFSFVGTAAFLGGGLASVRYAQDAGNGWTLVELDQGDGGAAEMAIRLDGLLALRGDHFIL